MSDDDEERAKVDVTGTSRMWTPRLVELHKVPHPEIDDNEPTVVYVDPRCVIRIERGVVRWELNDGSKMPSICCTMLGTTLGWVHVLESPQVVAQYVNTAMRGKA